LIKHYAEKLYIKGLGLESKLISHL